MKCLSLQKTIIFSVLLLGSVGRVNGGRAVDENDLGNNAAYTQANLPTTTDYDYTKLYLTLVVIENILSGASYVETDESKLDLFSIAALKTDYTGFGCDTCYANHGSKDCCNSVDSNDLNNSIGFINKYKSVLSQS